MTDVNSGKTFAIPELDQILFQDNKNYEKGKDMNDKKLEYINKNLYMSDSITSIKKEEARYIYEFLIEKKIYKTLEIGMAFGRSAAHIIAATNSRHIVIDPYQIDFQNLGIKNLQKLGFGEYLILKEDYSHNILPTLLKENQRFDFIFIDGGHRFDSIFIDFYYSDLLLEKDGYILFHDARARTTQLVISFVRTNRNDYRHINVPLRNLIMIQKVGDDNRSCKFHKEFFTLKSIIYNKLVNNPLISKMIIKIIDKGWIKS